LSSCFICVVHLYPKYNVIYIFDLSKLMLFVNTENAALTLTCHVI
jgi:hypothetical protein